MNITDPRAIRTKQLIIDAFQQLIALNNFEQITVKDITELATINRATFYAHFIDKYELLDIVLTETAQTVFDERLSAVNQLNKEAIVQIFISIVELHNRMHTNCRRGYNTFTQMIEEKAKQLLTDMFERLLPTHNRMEAIVYSWGIYGNYIEWDRTSKESSVEYAKKVAVHLLNT